MSQPQVNPLMARRAMVAASAGNIVEWYDWSVYATFAFYFSRQFFPSDTASTALIFMFAVFAVGFIARPLGSVTVGRITDRAGRKTSLAISVTIVAMASVLSGVAPTAATIGTWAAVWLVGRLAQRCITFTMTPYFMIVFAGASVVAMRMKETAFDPLRQ